MTQAQADLNKKRINDQAAAGTLGYGIVGGKHGGFGFGSAAIQTAISTKLGLTTTELHTQLESAATGFK